MQPRGEIDRDRERQRGIKAYTGADSHEERDRWKERRRMKETERVGKRGRETG